jgi:quercetin dioxygenase-like cupin family protein
MGPLTRAIACIVAGGSLAAVAGQGVYAAEKKKDVYVVPGADKKTLVSERLQGVEGYQLTIDHYTLPPGWVGGKHYHTGPVYVYVLEGSFTMDEQGKERHTHQAGGVYKEPIGTPMQARNLNASEPLKILVIQMTPQGEPLMYKAD